MGILNSYFASKLFGFRGGGTGGTVYTASSNNVIKISSDAVGINTQFIASSNNIIQISSLAYANTGISGHIINTISFSSTGQLLTGVSGSITQTISITSKATDIPTQDQTKSLGFFGAY